MITMLIILLMLLLVIAIVLLLTGVIAMLPFLLFVFALPIIDIFVAKLIFCKKNKWDYLVMETWPFSFWRFHMDINYILDLLSILEKDWFKKPTKYYELKKIDFEYKSYSHFAIEELRLYLLNHKNEDPIYLLDEFRNKMDTFACDSKTGNSNFMFSVYCDVATNVLDELLIK